MKKFMTVILSAALALSTAASAYSQDKAIENPYNQTIHCPILTYHDVTTDINKITDWTVTSEKFENDIKTLLENNYTPIFTKDLQAGIEGREQLPDNPVILQFDDGYSSLYELAFPILHKYGVKAEVYIITDYTKDVPYEHSNNKFLSWPQLKLMEDSGLVCVGLHGKSHEAVVNGFSDEKIKSDFSAAWEEIQNNLGDHPKYYVYPNGLFNANTLRSIKEAGADIQFIWVWNLSNAVKQYNVQPRTNVGGTTDILTAVSNYTDVLKVKLKH
ncbi:polysaccharide deacetylase family protein [Lachnospiraceae bacterium NSJ-143]|nr:polysaccharide deacetylase family protein [Lachnospiraceae bacterium NSJ-143]